MASHESWTQSGEDPNEYWNPGRGSDIDPIASDEGSQQSDTAETVEYRPLRYIHHEEAQKILRAFEIRRHPDFKARVDERRNRIWQDFPIPLDEPIKKERPQKGYY